MPQMSGAQRKRFGGLRASPSGSGEVGCQERCRDETVQIDARDRAMNPPPPNLGDRDLDGPGDPSLPKKLGQTPRGPLGLDAPGRLFCWKRALRGVGLGLSLLWFVLFHVGI